MKKTLKWTVGTAFFFFVVSFFAFNKNDPREIANADLSYTLTLNGDNAPSITGDGSLEGPKNVLFNYHSVSPLETHHVVLNEGGYVANDASTRITSVTYVEAVFSGVLELRFGSDAASLTSIYTPASGVLLPVSDYPYYFQAISTSGITTLTSLTFYYSCVPTTPSETATFRLSEDGTFYIVTGSANDAVDVVIPSTYNGLPVKEIANHAFAFDENLTSVVVPDSVTTLGEGVFSDSPLLTDVTLGNSITAIPDLTFYGSALTTVEIPESVTSIGFSAFAESASLTSLNLPTDLQNIGDLAFYNCINLATLSFPETLVHIGDLVFTGTPWLMNQQALNPLVVINEFLIDGQSASGDVVIPDTITHITGGAFAGNMSMTSITVPGSVDSIGTWAFNYASSLTTVTLNEGLTFIGNEAFAGSASLSSMTVPSTVTWIGSDAFSGNPWYETAILENPYYVINDILVNARSVTGSATIPEGVRVIAPRAFFGSAITDISFPSTLQIIGEEAFIESASLTSVVIPNTVTELGYGAFQSCASLQSVVLSNQMDRVPMFAFMGCTALTSVSIPVGITAIGDSAFSGCSLLESVVLPEGLTLIDVRAFEYCSGLTSVTLPSTLKTIQMGAFSFVTSLTTIVIPLSVTYVGDFAFDGSYDLTIHIEAETVPSSWSPYWDASSGSFITGYSA